MEAPLAQGIVGQFGNNHVATVSHGNDRGLNVEFFIMDEFKTFKSAQEGIAIYEPIEMVRMGMPGAKTDIIKQVTFKDGVDGPAIVNRFPAQYKAFKEGLEQVPDGTPLEMCKFMPSHRIKMLRAQGVHTAEQFAECSDAIVQTLGMGAARERDLCKAYVSSDDQKTRMMSKALADAEEMREQMIVMREQMEQLNRAMAHNMAGTGQIYQSTLEANFPAKAAPLPGEIFEEAPGPELKRGTGRPRKEN